MVTPRRTPADLHVHQVGKGSLFVTIATGTQAFAAGPPTGAGGTLPSLSTSAPPAGLDATTAPPLLMVQTTDDRGRSVMKSADCASVRANPAAFKSAGKSEIVCFDAAASAKAAKSPGTAELLKRTRAGVTPQAVVPSPQDACALNGKVNTWYYGREYYCYIALNYVVNTINPQNGALLGTATFTINHAVGLDSRGGAWRTFTSFYLESAQNNASTIVENTTSCVGPCSIQSGQPLGPGVHPVPLNQAIFGNANLAANPATNQIISNLSVAFNDGFRSPNSTPGYITFQAPASLNIRCDGQVNTGGAQGCAIPTYTPELQLSGYASGNVGVAFVYWFQYYNVDHWGQYPSGRPLTRLNNPTQADKNRTAMCKTGAWTANPAVPTDSCDEFPFAASKQSGAVLGINPTQCSQASFTFANGAWSYSAYPGYSTAQRCALGHVPLTYNTSVGGSYSSFIQNNRVLDNDPFWIGIYN